MVHHQTDIPVLLFLFLARPVLNPPGNPAAARAVSAAQQRNNTVNAVLVALAPGADADKVAETIENPEGQELLLMHGDNEEAAQAMEEMLRQKLPNLKGIRVQMIGPVIGAHCGPGTMCVAFFGKERAL